MSKKLKHLCKIHFLQCQIFSLQTVCAFSVTEMKHIAEKTEIKMTIIIMTNKQHIEQHFREITYKQVQMEHSPRAPRPARSINCC